jgi:hypothetical protein
MRQNRDLVDCRESHEVALRNGETVARVFSQRASIFPPYT